MSFQSTQYPDERRNTMNAPNFDNYGFDDPYAFGHTYYLCLLKHHIETNIQPKELLVTSHIDTTISHSITPKNHLYLL